MNRFVVFVLGALFGGAVIGLGADVAFIPAGPNPGAAFVGVGCFLVAAISAIAAGIGCD